MAIVLGHELAHVTHEHMRRDLKRSLWVSAIALGIDLAAEQMDNDAARAAVEVVNGLVMSAWLNGYGRSLEDQADRVGLRYAFEGGFDVTKGPRVWQRFEEKYGREPRILNFFFSEHARSPERRARLEQQVAWNYREGIDAPSARVVRPAVGTRAAAPAAAPRAGMRPDATADGSSGFRRQRAPADENAAGAAAACQHRRVLGLRPGMSPDDVMARLGPPGEEDVTPEGMTWTYDDAVVVFVGARLHEVRFP